jgi:hypothetical protein
LRRILIYLPANRASTQFRFYNRNKKDKEIMETQFSSIIKTALSAQTDSKALIMQKTNASIKLRRVYRKDRKKSFIRQQSSVLAIHLSGST